MTQPVYLDYNASTPAKPAVVEAVATVLPSGGNPSSVHGFGRSVRRRIEDAREQVAALVGVAPADLVFTSGATEANNLVLDGCGRRRILISAVEHDSVRAAVPDAEVIPVDGDGVVDLDALATLLRKDDTPALVSVMFANNETGVLQPVAEAAALARNAGALFHCDAVQGIGRVDIDLAMLGIDYLTMSGHKSGAPTGIGALASAPGVPLAPVLRGGGQERGRRAGTENVPGIVGFGAAAMLQDEARGDQPRLAKLRDALEARIKELCPRVPIHGTDAARIANTSCIGMPGVGSETQVMAFDLAGFAVSAGAACSSGKVTTSHVLRAMGVPEEVADCAIRVSLGWASTEQHIDRFVGTWRALFEKSVARSAA